MYMDLLVSLSLDPLSTGAKKTVEIIPATTMLTSTSLCQGSKVETLEDVLAGPETEVMDAIQVATAIFSLLTSFCYFGSLPCFIMWCRRELTVTIFERPQAPNGFRSGLFCPQTSPSQV